MTVGYTRREFTKLIQVTHYGPEESTALEYNLAGLKDRTITSSRPSMSEAPFGHQRQHNDLGENDRPKYLRLGLSLSE